MSDEPRRCAATVSGRGLLLIAGALTIASGCSVATEPESPMRDSLALEEAVRSYSSAYLRGDGQTAYDMLSARCRTIIDRGRLQQLSETATALYGQARLVSVRPQVDGDRATVTYRFDQPAIDQENEPWLREGGVWRYDEC